MSPAIGVINTQVLPKVGQKGEQGGVQIHLGKSSYQFNQVLDLVAPGAGGDSFQPNPEMLDADSMEQVATLLGERSENSTRKMLTANIRKMGGRQGAGGMGLQAYKIYSGTANSSDLAMERGAYVVSPSTINIQR